MIPLQTAFRERHPVTHLVFSPDQGTVAVAQPHAGVTLIERGTGRTRAVCPMPKRDTLTGLVFTGDGRLLVAASAKGLSVFDATDGTWIVNSTHGSNNGLLLADVGSGAIGVRADGLCREWPAHALTSGLFNVPWSGSRVTGTVLALCPAGRLVATGRAPGRVSVFDLAADRVIAQLDRPAPAPGPSRVPFARFCPLGHRLAIGDGRTLDVYACGTPAEEEDDAPSVDGESVPEWASGAEQRVSVAPAPHAVLAPAFTLRAEKSSAGDWRPPFALFPDGRRILVKRPRNRVQLWDAPTGGLVNEWSWQLEWVTCLAVAPDGLTAVAGGRFGRVILWDLD